MLGPHIAASALSRSVSPASTTDETPLTAAIFNGLPIGTPTSRPAAGHRPTRPCRRHRPTAITATGCAATTAAASRVYCGRPPHMPPRSPLRMPDDRVGNHTHRPPPGQRHHHRPQRRLHHPPDPAWCRVPCAARRAATTHAHAAPVRSDGYTGEHRCGSSQLGLYAQPLRAPGPGTRMPSCLTVRAYSPRRRWARRPPTRQPYQLSAVGAHDHGPMIKQRLR